MLRPLALSFAICALTAQAQDLGGDLTLHRLLIEGEGWQPVAEGIGFADGPCSDADGNFFYSDMKANVIFKIALDGTKTTVIEEPASGLKFGTDGRLYACQGAKKRLIAIDLATKAIDVIAGDVQPNDLAVTHRGHIYFTDTGKQELVFVDAKTKEKRAVDTGLAGPNGITLSPDQGTLAASEYKGGKVWAFRIEADGGLSGRAPYMTMRRPIDYKGEFKFNDGPPLKKESGGDGMTSDETGRYFVATALGVQVFDPTGRLCGVVPGPQGSAGITSCALAGPGRAWLYITARDKIFRRKVQAVGAVYPLAPK
ncbi:MAG: SMP-30/gluconolactonase/LRE family protein [Chthoniobacteraceae bacterium]